MNSAGTGRYLIAVWIAAVFLFLLCGEARSQENCTAAQCHATLVKGKTVHAAAEACDSCHESTATPHPQKGTPTFKLAQELPDLCSTCHEAFGTKKTVHPPVKEGACTTCHNPHSSDQPKLLAQPASELCVLCHGDKTDFAVVHGPTSAGDCLTCHLPHESDTPSLLVQEGENLCFTCHEDMKAVRERKNIHPALDAGCTSCHNPHGSAVAKLLPAKGKEVCFQCHSDISDAMVGAATVHAPIETDAGCVSCHSPHATDHPRLLAGDEKSVCLECHKTVLNSKMTVLHGPIREGRCTPCHDPHAGRSEALLKKAFSRDTYVPYTDTAYDLCFSCHNKDLVGYPDTSFATNFRDGERNLHYLHVNREEKGRNCKLCHNLHGGPLPNLVAESVPFGKWSLSLNFVKSESGGSCTPGCHKQYSYDRNSQQNK